MWGSEVAPNALVEYLEEVSEDDIGDNFSVEETGQMLKHNNMSDDKLKTSLIATSDNMEGKVKVVNEFAIKLTFGIRRSTLVWFSRTLNFGKWKM